jgi:hypothetical protein
MITAVELMKVVLDILRVTKAPFTVEIVSNDPEVILIFSKLSIPIFCSLDIKSQKDV